MTHTPGPWAQPERLESDVFDPRLGHRTESEDHLTIHLKDGDEVTGDDFILVHGPNQEANARLASAAPDMLAALHDLLTRPTDGAARERARAAIAKAEG